MRYTIEKIYMIFHFRNLIALDSDVTRMHRSKFLLRKNSMKDVYKLTRIGKRLVTPHFDNIVKVKFHIIFAIVYHTFWLLGPRIYDLQPNGDHHKNHKEILNQTRGKTFQKKKQLTYFLCIGSLYNKFIFK